MVVTWTVQATCESVRILECVECGRVSRENERGWTARLTIDDEVVVYCPECDEREFGEPG
jgi:Zn ribbon nucleic-acid-binding protein